MDRPRPRPRPTPLVVKKGSKMRSEIAAGTPGPRSRIKIDTIWPCWTACSAIWRSSRPSTASAALEMMLTSTCCNLTGPAFTASCTGPRSTSSTASAAFNRAPTISSVSRSTASRPTAAIFSLGLRAKFLRCLLIDAMRSIRPEMRLRFSVTSASRPRSTRSEAFSA
ncbi:hypothetical protein D3C78_1454500 [compost metagenome]